MKIVVAISVAIVLLLTSARLSAQEATKPAVRAPGKFRAPAAKDVFSYGKVILFQDDFTSGWSGKWRFSENDNYQIERANPDRIKILDAPGMAPGRKAARFTVERAPNSFRSEISLPSESGFHERWYGERILVPSQWVFDPIRGNDIMMQWHAVPGNGRPTNPNLEISIGDTNWYVRQSFGATHSKKTRTNLVLKDPVKTGTWVSWVIHAKWSPRADGVLQIWKDGTLVMDRKGPNVYTDIGVEYTPYLKTGIYHPEWHIDREERRIAFETEKPVATRKIIYVTDVKVASELAKYEDVAPTP